MRALLAATFLLLVGGTGCGDSPVARDDYPTAYQKAWCARAVRCGLASDPSSCEAGSVFDFRQSVASVAAGRAAFDDSAARACLDWLASPGCDFFSVPACGRAFTGLRQDAEACLANGDCRSGNCARVGCDAACCEGVCTEPSGVGAVCAADLDCAAGLGCKVGESVSTCQPLPGPGEHCDFQDECPAGYYCSLEFSPVDAPLGGTCDRAGGHGEACAPSFPDTSCVERDEYCDRASATCIARGGAGATCRLLLGGGIQPAGSTCQLAATCTDGRCVLRPVGDGTACTADCGSGYECRAGFCRVANAAAACP